MGLQNPPSQDSFFWGELLGYFFYCKGRNLQHPAETLHLITWVKSHSQAAFGSLGGFEELLFLYKLGGFWGTEGCFAPFAVPLGGQPLGRARA